MDTYKLLILALLLGGALILGVALGIAGFSFYWLNLGTEAIRGALAIV